MVESINSGEVSILILLDYLFLLKMKYELKGFEVKCFNPYFTGLPILIRSLMRRMASAGLGFNPYFTGLPILINSPKLLLSIDTISFNPYFTGLPILMFCNRFESLPSTCFNPYFTGLPILILMSI